MFNPLSPSISEFDPGDPRFGRTLVRATHKSGAHRCAPTGIHVKMLSARSLGSVPNCPSSHVHGNYHNQSVMSHRPDHDTHHTLRLRYKEHPDLDDEHIAIVPFRRFPPYCQGP